MTHETRLAVPAAAALAFFTAWGAVGCLYTAFDLSPEYPWIPVLSCGFAAVVSALLLSFRHGGTVLLCLLALTAGYLYRDGSAAEQFLQLVHRLTVIYDRAYGWGVLTLSAHSPDAVFFDWPLGITGGLIAMAVVRTVVRQGSTWLPVLVTLGPLCSCIVVTDTVPGEIWLLMVLAGLVLLVLTADLRRENAAQGLRLALSAALPVVLALSALFLTNPQDNYVNRSAVLRENLLIAAENIPKIMETGMNQLASGLQRQPARQVDLAGLGARIPFTYPVMEVTAEQSGTLYLRERDYDLYDGLGWQASEGREETFPGTAGQEESIIIRTENRKNTRYLPYHPARQAALTDGYAENPDREETYTVTRHRLPENWRQLVYQKAAASAEEWPQYRSLPDAARQGAAEFLEGLYSEPASNTEKADIIAAMVMDSARYDLDPGKMPPGETDFALWFLREGDRGYCVHFATAATVLLRAAGVPARYVTGYMLDTAAGEAVTVTEENAHAWAEYYEPGLGVWLPLEATPADEAAVQAPVISTQPVPPETTLPAEPVPETTAAVTETAAETANPEEPDLFETTPPVPEAPPASGNTGTFPWALLLLPLSGSVLAIQRSIRLALRRRRQRKGEINRQALQRWREAEYLTRLLKESPPEELILLAQKAKFSQYELTAEELAQFDSFCHACLRQLQKKPWYLRLVYQYIYAAY